MKVIKASYEIMNKENIDGLELLKTIERVGRTCYKSEDKITDESAVKFVTNLIKRGHEAMIEHNIISVRFICDRGITHELVRHRVASFGQESTRYCNYSKDKFGNQVTFINLMNGIELDTKMKDMTVEEIDMILNEWEEACKDAEKHYFNMLQLGATPQIARSVLPNSVKTEIVVTMNLREWRHFFKLRADAPAHPQMRELTIPLLNDMNKLIPVIFEDLI